MKMKLQMKKQTIIILASLGIVGGVGVGVYAGMQDTPATKAGHKSEEVVKEAAKNTPWQKLIDKDKDKKKEKSTQKERPKDVLASILDNRTTVEKRLSGFGLRERATSSKEGINKVALQAIDMLNTQANKDSALLAALDNTPIPNHVASRPAGDGTVINDLTPIKPLPNVPTDPIAPIDPNDGGGGTSVDPDPIEPIHPIEPNDAPVITSYDQQLHVGEVFNPMANVSAYDTEDGDLSAKVKVIANTVNMEKEGTYKVTYQVTDSQGARTTTRSTVKVLNDAPIIIAINKTVSAGSTFEPMRGVFAYDKEDGNITGKVEVLLNNVNTNKAGDYQVVYGVTDRHGKQTTKKISVKVTNEAPIITATNQTIEQGDTFDALAGVTASDKEDGDITSRLKVVNNTVDTDVVGEYEVTYQVTDNHGLTTEKTITVTVVHTNVAPIIEAKDVLIRKNSDFDVLSKVTAFDEEDGDITDHIQVIKNTVDMTTVGIYDVTYQVTDSNGATAEKTVKVTVFEVVPFKK